MMAKRIHYFYAQNWPMKIWFGLSLSLCVVIVLGASDLTVAKLGDWHAFSRLAVIVALALLIGFGIAFVFSWLILSPLYRDRLQKNGGPYQIGDLVEILHGPHRGKVVRVYSLGQGYSVSVELGDKEKESGKDIFAGTRLLLKNRHSENT
jgi:hypothetical protein